MNSRYARVPSEDDDEAYPPRSTKVFHVASGAAAAAASYDARVSRYIIGAALGSCAFIVLLVLSLWPSGGDFDTLFLRLTGPVWRIINATDSPDAELSPYQSESVLAQRLFSPECAELWVAKGELCPALHGQVGIATHKSLDIIWTWVNGSDPFLADWRDALLHNKALPDSVKPPVTRRAVLTHPHRLPGSGEYHYRQHNELLFSMRSSLAIADSLVRSRILVTADLPTSDASKRVGQVPSWLKDDADVHVRHHWRMFGTRASQNPALWRFNALPTFNSLAIESQLGHLNSAETILYMNDDSFVANSLTAADIATPLFGTVMRMQQDLPVRGRGEHQRGDDLEGEWPSLGYTNAILDRRFGTRPRPYATHVSKIFSRPLLLEVEAVFGDEFARLMSPWTGSSRFRGKQVDMHVSFMALHYIIEKHRETLLWSFVFGRRLGRQGIIDLLRQSVAPSVVQSETKLDIIWPNRTTLEPNTTANMLTLAGLDQPGTTKWQFSSADGYAVIELDPQRVPVPPHAGGGKGMGVAGVPQPPVPPASFDRWPTYRWTPSRRQVGCQIDLDVCFPVDLEDDADRLMRHIAFAQPKCGDCLIVALLHQSGPKGFEAFLPPSSTFGVDVVNPPTPGGLASTWQEASYLPPLSRLDVVRLLQRYSYIIGMSWSRFLNIRSTSSLPVLLGQLEVAIRREPRPAFGVINDDVKTNNAMPGIDRSLLRFYMNQWPTPAPWERALPADKET